MTDILASLLGVSMVISSGTAKSAGLYVMDTLNISEFWMPALIGGVALPPTCLVGICTQPASTANSRRHCHEIETGNTERQATMGAI